MQIDVCLDKYEAIRECVKRGQEVVPEGSHNRELCEVCGVWVGRKCRFEGESRAEGKESGISQLLFLLE